VCVCARAADLHAAWRDLFVSCDVTHSYVWRDSSAHVLVRMCDVPPTNVRYCSITCPCAANSITCVLIVCVSIMCVSWLTHMLCGVTDSMCAVTHSCVVTRLTYMCDMTRSYVVTWLIHTCDMTRWCRKMASCVTWLTRMCDATHSFIDR